MTPKRKLIVCAGTVTLRHRKDKDPQVLLVHRPAYDDWSLPKGHLEPDEYHAVTAVRETREETGVTVRLLRPAGEIRYQVGSGNKVVHYWLGTPASEKKRKADKEVDKVAWLTPKSALARMSYADERDLLKDVLKLEGTTPFVIVRHAKAMDRKNWSHRDQARPLTARGRRQSLRLIPLLEAYGIQALESSSSMRCMQTLQPYARRLSTEVHGWSVLSEEIGEDNPAAVTRAMRRLAKQAAESGTPTAVCGHRPVLPTMLEALDVPVRPLQTAAAYVAHLDRDGKVVAWEFHRPHC